MNEIGIDISKQISKKLTHEMLEWADFLVILSPLIDENSLALPSGLRKMNWPMPNLKEAIGNFRAIWDQFRDVRDEILQRVVALNEDVQELQPPKKNISKGKVIMSKCFISLLPLCAAPTMFLVSDKISCHSKIIERRPIKYLLGKLKREAWVEGLYARKTDLSKIKRYKNVDGSYKLILGK